MTRKYIEASSCGRVEPTPYYKRSSMCAEDSRETQVIERVSQVFRNCGAFCVPGCGAKVRVVFENVVDVAVGAYMWAYGIGYLEVTFFNANTLEVELRNNCPRNISGQAAPGTPIPDGTVFVLTAPPIPSATSTSDNTYPYLNSGFVAPESGECVDIAVTNVNGLSVNKNVAINSGIYRVDEIKTPVLITVCNDGSGLTPGTVVSHADSAGNLVVPIVLIDSNVCLNDAATHGKLLACTNNVTNVLAGTANGQVPVYDSGTGEVNFRTLGIPTLECTPLIVCLTLDPDLPESTTYLVQVESTSAFAEDQVVLIGGTSFVITSVDGPNQMHIRPEEAPSAVQTYNVGTSLCSADCCTVLDSRLTAVESFVLDNINPDSEDVTNKWLWCEAGADGAELSAPVTISDGNTTETGPEGETTFTNGSSVYSMRLMIHCTWTWQFDLTGADGNAQDIGFFANQSGNPDVAGIPVGVLYDLPHTYIYQTTAGGINRHSVQYDYVTSVVIPPGDSFTFRASAGIAWAAGNATSANVNVMDVNFVGFGVAIR